jgi:capsid protein
LRAGMTKAQRERTDAVVTAERHRLRVEWELVRRQARGGNCICRSMSTAVG